MDAPTWSLTECLPPTSTRLGPGTARSSTQPRIVTNRLYLYAAAAPIQQGHARRALAYALDRRALTTTLTARGDMACQLIPPGFAAYRPYCPFTLSGDNNGEWNGPDVATARPRPDVGNPRAKVVLLTFGADPGPGSTESGRPQGPWL